MPACPALGGVQACSLQVVSGNGALPPLFCVPLLVKDNMETVGMAACNGAASLLDNIAPADCTVVRTARGTPQQAAADLSTGSLAGSCTQVALSARLVEHSGTCPGCMLQLMSRAEHNSGPCTQQTCPGLPAQQVARQTRRLPTAAADAAAWVQVQRLRDAGAVVLGKSNMAEWAFSPDWSVGSAYGVVRNPYNLDYFTAGSSGGTAAGVAPTCPLEVM